MSMPPTNQPQPDAELDRVLKQWTVTTPLPPRFKEEVWRRIEGARPQPASLFALVRSLWSMFTVSVSNPRGAVAYATVFCVIGLAAGALAAEAHSRHTADSLRSRYVLSIDPFAGESQSP